MLVLKLICGSAYTCTHGSKVQYFQKKTSSWNTVQRRKQIEWRAWTVQLATNISTRVKLQRVMNRESEI